MTVTLIIYPTYDIVMRKIDLKKKDNEKQKLSK